MVSAFDSDRSADPSHLAERLDHIRLALGADRLALARRLSRVAEHRQIGPFEVLGGAGRPAPEGVGVGVPVEIVHRLMREGRPLDLRRDAGSLLEPVFDAWDCSRLLAWPLPRDRRPSIFAVALLAERPDPGPIRIRTALTGLDALARALAPPDWLPLARPPRRRDGIPEASSALLRGGSAVAIELRRAVQAAGSEPGPLMVEGPPGSGRSELAGALLGEEGGAEPTDARELLSVDPRCTRARIVRGLWDLGAAEQARLADLLASRADEAPRWIFLVRDELRARADGGGFRRDLYWALAARRVVTGPLRERSEDVVEIFRHLWRERTGGDVELEPRASDCLRRAAWPGHYRQLRAEAQRLQSRHSGARRVRWRWLSPELRRRDEDLAGGQSLSEALEHFERELLQRALRVAEGNKTLAARRLCVSRQGLYRKLRRYGLIPAGRGGTADDAERDWG